VYNVIVTSRFTSVLAARLAVRLSAMSHLRFCHATKSRDFDVQQSHSVRLHSRTLRLWRSVIRIAGSHVCLLHAASKSQRATMKSHAATLTRDSDARQSRTLRLWRSVIRIAGSHVCLSHAASKSQRATVKSYAATLSRVRVARQSRATKSQVWHGTYLQH